MKKWTNRCLMIVALLALGSWMTAQGAAPVPKEAAESSPKDTSKPVSSTLEVRAQTAFNNSQWTLALQLLKQAESQLKDKPDRLAAVQEQIRVCEKNIAKGAPGVAAAGPTTYPATGSNVVVATQPTAEARKPIPTPKAGQVTDILIKDLGNFDYDIEKGGNIPADIKALNGTKFRTHGYMIPLDQAESISEFALVPSLFACCFGQPPQIQHTLVVHCPKGKAVSYYGDEIIVEGTIKVEEKKDDGYIISIFEIDASSVKPAPK